MDWHRPQFLYLILPLCVSWLALALFSEKRRQRARMAFAAQAMWPQVFPASTRVRFWTKQLLQQLAVLSGLMALAGPQFGTQLENVVARGSDLYVLIDVSRSMLAQDVPPSRLERARADVSALVNRLEGERIGLIAFAGQAVVKCPLTVDYDSFRRALNELDTDSAPRGGTAIGDAIRKALEVFHSRAERDQAILLITDGDDQQSYPLEAAAVAAERKVTIFTVGLGDPVQGSRVPRRDSPATYIEHDGQQVWSKLDGKLLQEIAVQTSGVYIPAGTRSYDLGELYVNHLQGRKGDEQATQQRIRKSERFQIFLAIALLALLADLSLSPCQSVPNSKITAARSNTVPAEKKSAGLAAVSVLLIVLSVDATGQAGEAQAKVREGLKLYQQQEFEQASTEFAAAEKELSEKKSEHAAIAAFDEACAWHRKGDAEKARAAYLRAGLSKDRTIATAAHFNLGTMSAESARNLAGAQPDDVPPEKRQAILDELKQAVVSYRHCLELQPEHAASRRNLELVRNWIKHYSDRWREVDRQKKRDETNLIQFLDFLMQSQSALKESVLQLPEQTNADLYAELKRSQDELQEEIPVLRDKIAAELQPAEVSPGAGSAAVPQEIQEGISLLQGWADQAGENMATAGRQLARQEPKDATAAQQKAVDELDQIRDAVIPFLPLLAEELKEQTTISESLKAAAEPAETLDSPPSASTDPNATPAQKLASSTSDPEPLARDQDKVLRKARLLAPKAEAELKQLESQAASEPPAISPTAPSSATPDAAPQAAAPDPEAVKAGLRKAVELAPKAVEAMESSVQKLNQHEALAAAPFAEEARKILEEIQNAQPAQPQDPDQPPQQDEKQNEKQDEQKDKDQGDQQQQDQKSDSSKDQKDGDDQQKKQNDRANEKKDADRKKDADPPKQDQKSDKNKSDKSQSKASSDNSAADEKQPISQDRIEEALRKVRERQQEKRERDREIRARVFGRAPVDKDW